MNKFFNESNYTLIGIVLIAIHVVVIAFCFATMFSLCGWLGCIGLVAFILFLFEK